MPHKAVPVRVKSATSPRLAQLWQDYQMATEQYGVIVRYVKGAVEVLPKAECQLLLEFAETAKKHCERLHRQIQNHLGARRIAQRDEVAGATTAQLLGEKAGVSHRKIL
jgi:hypothetical protein